MSDPSAQVERNLAVGARLVELNERDDAEGVVRHFDEIFHPDFELRPAVSGLGEDVYVVVGKESGLDLDSEYAMLVRVDEGRVVWGRAFLSHAEAKPAAGGT